MNKALLLLFASASLPAMAQTAASVQAYYLNKNNSAYDNVDINVKGVYGYLGYGKHSLELEYDTLEVKGDDNSWQDDWVALYSNYQIPGWQLKFGFHKTKLSNQFYEEVKGEAQGKEVPESTWVPYVEQDSITTPIVGATYTRYSDYGYKLWNAGIDLFQASYESSSSADFIQLSPHYGHYFAVGEKGHYLYANLTLHSQFYDEPINGDAQFFNTEASITYVATQTSYTLSGQLGDNVNQYNLGGFSMSPDNRTYTKNLQLSVAHSLSAQWFVKGLIRKQYYKADEGGDESIRTLQFNLGYNF